MGVVGGVTANGEGVDDDVGGIGEGEGVDVGRGASGLGSVVDADEGQQHGEAVDAVLHAREELKLGGRVGAVGGWGPSQAGEAEYYSRRRLQYGSYPLAHQRPYQGVKCSCLQDQ